MFARMSGIQDDLKGLVKKIKYTRADCWADGYNMDEVGHYLAGSTNYYTKSTSSSACDEKEQRGLVVTGTDDAKPIISVRENVMTVNNTDREAWATKLDRINFWLLQNLCSSESQAELHRSFFVPVWRTKAHLKIRFSNT
jgi:hypothetical protein